MAEPLSYRQGLKTTSVGNSLCETPIPGYLGYSPKRQHFFGERYATVRKLSKQKHDRDVQLNALKFEREQISRKNHINNMKLKQNFKTPLKPRVDKVSLSYPKVEWQHGSLYTLSDDHPGKQLMTGYQGFVPRAEEFMGVAYPNVTRRALCRFNAEMTTFLEERAKPLDLNRNIRKEKQHITNVYHADTGMMPQYSGHIPGARYIYGKPFAAMTKEAICQSKAARKTK